MSEAKTENNKSCCADKLPASVCPDPSWPFGDKSESYDLFDSMPLHEKQRSGLTSDISFIDLVGKGIWISFLFILLSGIGLLAGYKPTVDGSYSSIEYIQKSFPGGWWLRGIHKYATDIFVILALIRILRLAFRRAYKAGGEITWITAVFILLFGIISGLTGYLLVWHQNEFWIGRLYDSASVSDSLFSEQVMSEAGLKQSSLQQVFSIHIGLSAVFLGIILFWRLSPKCQMLRYKTFHPALDIWFVVIFLGIFTLLALFVPPPLGSPVDRTISPHPLLADWYMLPFYQVARWVSSPVCSIAGILFVIFLIFVPWLDRRDEAGPLFFTSLLIVLFSLSVLILAIGAMGGYWTFSRIAWILFLVWGAGLLLGFQFNKRKDKQRLAGSLEEPDS